MEKINIIFEPGQYRNKSVTMVITITDEEKEAAFKLSKNKYTMFLMGKFIEAYKTQVPRQSKLECFHEMNKFIVAKGCKAKKNHSIIHKYWNKDDFPVLHTEI